MTTLDIGYRAATLDAHTDATGDDRLLVELDDRPDRLRVRIVAREAVELTSLVVQIDAPIAAGQQAWFNGYQTWSESFVGPIGRGRRRLQPITRLFRMAQYGDELVAADVRDARADASHEVFAVQQGETARLWGSRLGDRAFTIFEPAPGSIRIVVDVAGWSIEAGGTALVLDLDRLTGAEAPELLRTWAANSGYGRRDAPAITGWTSWYQYYAEIDAAKLHRTIDDLASSGVHFDVFQIDDGYQAHVGDWLELLPGFAEGMAPLAEHARSAGYRPGLWLAPFVAARGSRLVREHPDWVLRDASGRRVTAGWNAGWKGAYFALDLEHPDVLVYLAEVFRVAREEWGYAFFKLDFLYAAALDTRPGRTRADRMRRAMMLVREWVGDAAVLACGVPLVSAAGLVEYARVGSDVAAYWEDRLLRGVGYRERVSTVSSLRSTIARSWMDGTWFRNDPDVVILRTQKNRLTADEQATLFALNRALGSLVFVSDDVTKYTPEALATLSTLSPLPEARVQRVSLVGETQQLDVTLDGRPFRIRTDLGQPAGASRERRPRRQRGADSAAAGSRRGEGGHRVVSLEP